MDSRHRVHHSDFLKRGVMRHDVAPTNKCNISEQNLHDRENKTCEGEIPRQSTNPSGDCYTILQTELIDNIYDY